MGVTTAVSEGAHSGNLPMVSVCNVSPYQCLCEAFYDPLVIKDEHFDKVIPYLCKEVLVYQDSSPDPLDPKTGKPLSSSVLEDNLKFVDKVKTKAKIEAFRTSLLKCDKDGGRIGSHIKHKHEKVYKSKLGISRTNYTQHDSFCRLY